MITEKEQFKRELVQQEIQANKRILAGFRYFTTTYVAVWFLSMVGFFEMDRGKMTLTLFVMLPMLVVPEIIGNHHELSKPWLKYVFLTIICVATGAIAGIFTIHAVLAYVLPLLFAVQCRQSKVLWFTYVTNIVTMLFSSLFGFYYGICDLNILAGKNLSLKNYMKMAPGGILQLPVEGNYVFTIIVFEVLPRAMILLVFALMLRYTVLRSTEDAVRIAELTWRKETDLNTGVYNKNKYEEMSDEYYPTIERIAAVFWDMNNLKKTNDKYGHAVGDALISTFSHCLQEEGDERYRVYRLGGDEFVMVIDNPVLHEPQKAIASVRERLLGCTVDTGNGTGMKVSSAVGWSTGEGKYVRRVVEVADANMYADKIQSREGRRR